MLFTVPKFIVLLLAIGEPPPPWWDYPGLEAWKFFNLLVFIGAGIYFLKRPLTEAFRLRLETIRRDLVIAQQGRDRAVAELAEIQSRLANLDSEVAQIEESARSEAVAERDRIAKETELEINKLREQAQREIVSAGKVVRHELRVFAAHQSVKLAEELIRRQIRPEDDVKLVAMNVERLGRG